MPVTDCTLIFDCCTWQVKHLLDELKAKLDQNQTDLAKEKEEEELKLKEVEQEATEVKEMKANLSESMTEAKQVAVDEKMLRKKKMQRLFVYSPLARRCFVKMTHRWKSFSAFGGVLQLFAISPLFNP